MAADTRRPPTPADLRQARLEQELRANLLKRKQQARARRDDPAVDDAGQGNPTATGPSHLPPGQRSD